MPRQVPYSPFLAIRPSVGPSSAPRPHPHGSHRPGRDHGHGSSSIPALPSACLSLMK